MWPSKTNPPVFIIFIILPPSFPNISGQLLIFQPRFPWKNSQGPSFPYYSLPFLGCAPKKTPVVFRSQRKIDHHPDRTWVSPGTSVSDSTYKIWRKSAEFRVETNRLDQRELKPSWPTNYPPGSLSPNDSILDWYPVRGMLFLVDCLKLIPSSKLTVCNKNPPEIQ